jgi:hypothetical protein
MVVFAFFIVFVAVRHLSVDSLQIASRFHLKVFGLRSSLSRAISHGGRKIVHQGATAFGNLGCHLSPLTSVLPAYSQPLQKPVLAIHMTDHNSDLTHHLHQKFSLPSNRGWSWWYRTPDTVSSLKRRSVVGRRHGGGIAIHTGNWLPVAP